MAQYIFSIFLIVSASFQLLGQPPRVKKAAKWVNQGKYEKTIKKTSLWLDENKNAALFHLRGYAHSKLGESEKAIADYDESITLDNKEAQYFFDRGYEYFLQNSSLMALQDFNSAIQLDLNFAEAFLNRGTVKFQMGDERGACSDWSTASSLGIALADEIIAVNCPSYHD